MSGLAKDEHSVNRLLDIVVEEVSLVDRAANKHRFLIVKRSDEMDDTPDTTTTPADDATADTQPADAADSHAASADEGTAEGEGTGGSPVSAPLNVAIAALEGLTETVELLGTLGEDAAAPRLAELATELRGVSDQLARAAGDEPDASTDAGDGGDTAGAKDGADLTTVIDAVRATIERVGGLLATGGDPDAKADANAAASAADGDTAGPISELASELRALTDAVKAQQQRLARLEKRFGLPNSAPSGERPPRAGDDDVGWPMDLNRAFDRESVDKSISFHDV